MTQFQVAGYRLLLRYEGMDEIGDNAYDFWVNIGSEDIRPVGKLRYIFSSFSPCLVICLQPIHKFMSARMQLKP